MTKQTSYRRFKWRIAPSILLIFTLLAMTTFSLAGQEQQNKFKQLTERFQELRGQQSPGSLMDRLRQPAANSQLPWLERLNSSDWQNNSLDAENFDRNAFMSKFKQRAGQSNHTPLESGILTEPYPVEWADPFEDGFFISTSIAADDAGYSYTAGFFEVGYFVIKRDAAGVGEWAVPIFADDFLFELGFIFGTMQIAVDDAGNIYVCGAAFGDTDFESISGPEITLPSAVTPRMFLAKYDKDGDVQWVTSADIESGFSAAMGITVDDDGNIYITGTFEDDILLGPGETNATLLVGDVGLEPFWAKYNSDGELLWAKQAIGDNIGFAAGIPIDAATDVTVDVEGNVFVVGVFETNLLIEPGTSDETLLEASLTPYGVFILKYSEDGDFLAVIDEDIPFFPLPFAIFPLFWSPDIIAAPNGNIYLSTNFFDSSTGISFVVAMDVDGDILWVSPNAGEDPGPYVFDLATDAASNAFAHGIVTDDADFDIDGADVPYIYPGSGGANVFLEKLDSEGCLQWVRTEAQLASSIFGAAVATSGSCVFTAITNLAGDDIIIGPEEPNETLIDFEGTITVKYKGSAGKAFTLLAAKDIEINRPQLAVGDMHANDDIDLNSGDPSTYDGNLSAVDDIDIARDNTIDGDVTAGGDLDNDGTITGTASENADVDPVPLPVLDAFSAGTEDVTVEDDDDLALDPGAYRDVEVERDGILRLSAGEYFLDELELGTDTRLIVDVSGGAVTVNIVSDLEFGQRMTVSVSGGSSALFTINSIQSKNIDIGREATVRATIIAPDAKVRADSYVYFAGSICAEDISFGIGSLISTHAFGLPKVLADDTAAVASPQTFELAQNYPNPFNPTTNIGFRVAESEFISLQIFDISGRLVKTLLNESRDAGEYTVQWDATNSQGQRVGSGIYFYKITAGDFQQVRKMMLIK